jgi:transposase-like protein
MVKSLAKKKKRLMETIMLSNRIDTVMGTCSECEQDTVLVAIVSDFYRCTSCGYDNRQHINGKISYLKLTDEDKKFIKLQSRLNNG